MVYAIRGIDLLRRIDLGEGVCDDTVRRSGPGKDTRRPFLVARNLEVAI